QKVRRSVRHPVAGDQDGDKGGVGEFDGEGNAWRLRHLRAVVLWGTKHRREGFGRTCYLTSPTRRSITLVWVGPVLSRPPVCSKNGYELLIARYSAGSSDSFFARAITSASTSAPAASVGPSSPSVPPESSASRSRSSSH